MGGEIPSLLTVNSVMETEVKDKTTSEIDIKKPSLYQVILYNDDKTPMEFVIELLKNVYTKTQEQAETVTMSVHKDGKGVAGVYYYEVAEQKVHESILVSRSAGYPLSLDIEEL